MKVRLLMSTAGLLLACVATAAQVEPGLPGVLGPIDLPRRLRPPVGMPLPGKDEKKVLACLSRIYTNRGFYTALFGDEPAPSLPNAAANCRLRGTLSILERFQPRDVPADLAFTVADQATLSDLQLRDYVAGLTAQAGPWDELISWQRRIHERLADMATHRTLLLTKMSGLLDAGSLKWPDQSIGFLLSNPECLADTAAEQEAAAARLRDDYAPFAFYESYRAVAFGVSLLGEEVIPGDVAYCEKGLQQKACFTPPPRDWSTPGCWDRNSPAKFQQVACADNFGSRKLIDTGAGSGCAVEIQGVVPPFFSETKKMVESRRNSGSYKTQLAEFVAMLRTMEEKISAADRRFSQARSQAIDRINPQYSKLLGLLSAERARLQLELSGIETERAALGELAQTIARHQQQLVTHAASISKLDQSLVQNTQALANATLAREHSEGDEESAKAALDRAVQARDDTKLECAGASYERCQDDDAKLAYDEALYATNETIAKAMTEWQAALDYSMQCLMEELELTQLVTETHTHLALTRAAEADLKIVLLQAQKEHAQRSTVLARRQERYDAFKSGHDRDTQLILGYTRETALPQST